MTNEPRAFLRPPWLRPLASAAALALHVGIAMIFVIAPEAPPNPLGDVVVGIESAVPDTAPEETPSPIATETPVAEPSPAPTPTETASLEPTPAPAPEPTPTQTAMETPSPEPMPSPTETLSPDPTPSLQPIPTPTEAPSPDLTPTPKPTPTPSETPAPDPKPSPRPTLSRPPTPRPTRTPPPPAPKPPRLIARPLVPLVPKPRPAASDEQIAKQREQQEARRRAVERSSGGPQGGRSGAPVASTADLASYGALVSAEIARHKNPAAVRAAGEGGSVRIAFAIGASGRVVSHAVVGSSGNATLDAAANAMMYAVQAPPPPGGSFRGQITIRFQMQ